MASLLLGVYTTAQRIRLLRRLASPPALVRLQVDCFGLQSFSSAPCATFVEGPVLSQLRSIARLAPSVAEPS